MSDPRTQSQYQVRFSIGDAGRRELDDADILLIADELGGSGETIATAGEAAARVLAEQTGRGARVSVAVVARGMDGVALPVADLLAAGALIDALAEVGIDHCSPEAAVVAASYTGLRHATRHLVSASVSARVRESAEDA